MLSAERKRLFLYTFFFFIPKDLINEMAGFGWGQYSGGDKLNFSLFSILR